MSQLLPDETAIEGHWVVVRRKVVADDATLRIERLVADHLAPIAASADGWSKLFRDPDDGRLWEHTYPQSEMHGGGPPRLEVISLEKARLRYSIAS
jgi:hypothetical protein